MHSDWGFELTERDGTLASSCQNFSLGFCIEKSQIEISNLEIMWFRIYPDLFGNNMWKCMILYQQTYYFHVFFFSDIKGIREQVKELLKIDKKM